MSTVTASFLKSLSPEKWKSLESIWIHVIYCLAYMKSRTHLHSTVITTAQGRTEKGADVCFLEAEEIHTKTQLEMLTCDADQLQKGLWDLGCAGPLNREQKAGYLSFLTPIQSYLLSQRKHVANKIWCWDFQQEERWVYSSHICGLRLLSLEILMWKFRQIFLKYSCMGLCIKSHLYPQHYTIACYTEENKSDSVHRLTYSISQV